MFVCKQAFVTAWVFFTGYSMTDGCLLTDDVTFKAVISVPPSSRLPAMRLFASLLLIIIPAETGHTQILQAAHHTIGIRGVPLTRVEGKLFPQPISRPGCTGSPGVVGCYRCARGEFTCNIACQWEAGTRTLFYQPLETNLMEKSPRFWDMGRDQTHLESSTNLLHMWKK